MIRTRNTEENQLINIDLENIEKHPVHIRFSEYTFSFDIYKCALLTNTKKERPKCNRALYVNLSP